MTKRILFITGTRADFGKLEPLAAAARDAGFPVTFFVTGMHLMDRYGRTKLEVAPVSGRRRSSSSRTSGEGDPQDMILAKTVIGFSDFLTEHRPDLAIVHGDRIEALACALVCATNYIRSAHVEGGEVSGTIDEVFRHCNTKLATHHFVSSADAAARVSWPWASRRDSIHVIGSPELDFHSQPSGVSIAEVQGALRHSLRRLWHLHLPSRHLRGRHDGRTGRGPVRHARRLGPELRADRARTTIRGLKPSSG